MDPSFLMSPRDSVMMIYIHRARMDWQKVHIRVPKWAVEHQVPVPIPDEGLTLNIGAAATSQFWHDADDRTIRFKTRFNGNDTWICVPVSCIDGIFNPHNPTHGLPNPHYVMCDEDLVDVLAVLSMHVTEDVQHPEYVRLRDQIEERKKTMLKQTGWPQDGKLSDTKLREVVAAPILDTPDEELPSNVVRVNFGAKR